MDKEFEEDNNSDQPEVTVPAAEKSFLRVPAGSTGGKLPGGLVIETDVLYPIEAFDGVTATNMVARGVMELVSQ